MNLKETGAVMDILAVAYPQFYKNQTTDEQLMAARLWAEMFKDDDVGVLLAAVKAHIATDSKGFPPHIGAIKAAIVKLTRPPELEMTELEAWKMVSDATKNSTYGAVEEFNKLPVIVQRIVGSPNQLREWAKMDSDTVQSVVSSNFQRSFKARAASEREYLALPSDIRQTMERLSAGTVRALEGARDGQQ